MSRWADRCRYRIRPRRTFTDQDTEEIPKVIVVNESLALRVFAGEDPIGKRITVWPNETFTREIGGCDR